MTARPAYCAQLLFLDYRESRHFSPHIRRPSMGFGSYGQSVLPNNRRHRDRARRDPLLLGLEFQRHAVHAITLAGGVWTVREHVPQMPAAARAMHFGAGHAETSVRGRAHRLREW